MTGLIVHLHNEDEDEGAALRWSLHEQGKELHVVKIQPPFGPDLSVDRMYEHVMGEPLSAVSHVDLRGVHLNAAYMTVHKGGHAVVLAGEFDADEALRIVSSAKLAGYFVHVSSLESEVHLTL